MEEAMLGREDVLKIVRGLKLPGDGWWITSGAALVLYGVKERTRDVDLICTTELADALEREGVPFKREESDNTRIFALNSQVEVLENWHTDEVGELDGLRIATLPSIRSQKEELGREKDWADIRLIDAFLAKGSGMFSVAIDGPAGAGKSSVARAAAKELGFVYVDTGALYRTIALYLLEHRVDLDDQLAVEAALPEVQIDLSYGPEGQRMFLGGVDVTGLIRTPEVSMATSAISAIPAVRAFLLELQRDLARKNNVLMDGRDIGTVVLPDAQVKVFLTASPEVRARRRVIQLKQAGQQADYKHILADIVQRDYQDSHRAAAPLKQAEDAVLLDTSELDFQQSVEKLVALVREKI